MANLLVSHISHEKLLSLVTNSSCFHTAKAGWTSCIALLKNTLSCFFLLLCTLTPLEGPGGSKTPTFFFFDLRASLSGQGSGSRSRDSLDLLPGFIYSSCLLSTMAPAVCKSILALPGWEEEEDCSWLDVGLMVWHYSCCLS